MLSLAARFFTVSFVCIVMPATIERLIKVVKGKDVVRHQLNWLEFIGGIISILSIAYLWEN